MTETGEKPDLLDLALTAAGQWMCRLLYKTLVRLHKVESTQAGHSREGRLLEREE